MKTYLVQSIFVSIYLYAINGQPYYSYDGSQNSYESSRSIVVPIGRTKHHPIEYVDYNLDTSEDRQPRTFHVDGGNIPLNIIFNPRLDHLKVGDQNDQTFGKNERYTRTEEEPVYMYHEMNTPVFEEVLQTIPYNAENDKQNDYNNYDQNWQTVGQNLC